MRGCQKAAADLFCHNFNVSHAEVNGIEFYTFAQVKQGLWKSYSVSVFGALPRDLSCVIASVF